MCGLDNKQIMPTIYYWARRLQCKHASFDELVNEAYIVSKVLKSPLLLKKWVKWTMIHFISSQKKHSILANMGQNILHGFEDDEHNSTTHEEHLIDKSFNIKEFREFREDLLETLSHLCSVDECRLLHRLFWESMSYREIAKLENVKFQTIFFRVNKVLGKLRRHYERESK